MTWIKDALQDREHPIWGMIDQIVKTGCSLVLFAGCVGFWAWMTASNFDATEGKMVGGATVTVAAYKIGAVLWNKFSS